MPRFEPKLYREHFQKVIFLKGLDAALAHEDFIIFYTGPCKYVRDNFPKHAINNQLRAAAMAKILAASIINDTWAAQKLAKKDLTEYFLSVLTPKYRDPAKLVKALDRAYVEVWGGVSALFAKRPFRHCATALCGFGMDRVFAIDEIPILVDTLHLQTSNLIDFQPVRDMYKQVHPYEGIDLLCRSELKFVYLLAKFEVAGHGAWFFKDYGERQYFYDLKQTDPDEPRPKLTAAQEKTKKEIIGDYDLSDIYGGPPEWIASTRPSPTKKGIVAILT